MSAASANIQPTVNGQSIQRKDQASSSALVPGTVVNGEVLPRAQRRRFSVSVQ